MPQRAIRLSDPPDALTITGRKTLTPRRAERIPSGRRTSSQST